MHVSSILRMKYLLDYYMPYIEKELKKDKEVIRVLDIGSFGRKRTYRELFCQEDFSYTGLDMQEGPNVDIVPKSVYSWDEIGDGQYDIVISGQCFEHIEYPWLTIKEIERVLADSGLCVLIAPSGGREHKAPLDCYRYYGDGLRALAKWADLDVLHAGVGGVPALAHTDDWVCGWNDATLVARKTPGCCSNGGGGGLAGFGEPFKYERRIINGQVVDSYKNENIALEECANKFGDDKKYILFGASVVGERILHVIGAEKVYCFVDNSPEKVGRTIEGKRVISFDEFRDISKEYHCLVTAQRKNSIDIKKQLKENQIDCFTLYPDSES